jgi:hypothetical protein
MSLLINGCSATLFSCVLLSNSCLELWILRLQAEKRTIRERHLSRDVAIRVEFKLYQSHCYDLVQKFKIVFLIKRIDRVKYC